jgi:hypothetical protein
MFNKIAFSNYYLRKRRDLRKDGEASIIRNIVSEQKSLLHKMF